ncbi:Hypothetical protein HDN1F_16390 [gamma proteobacterium HdN1]|nr:Hypothetical protein HDN1F_16390 [gamma proteobacterium HdN1]
MKHWQKPLILSVVVAIALYFFAMLLTDFTATRAALARMSASAWFIIIGLSLFNYALRFWRWSSYIDTFRSAARDGSAQHQNNNLSIRRHLSYYLAGFSLSTTPGKAGEAIRSIYLRYHGVSYHDSISALFVERLLDLIAITLLAVLACIYFPQYEWIAGATAAVALISLFLIREPKVLSWGEKVAAHLGRLQKISQHMIIMLRSAVMLMSNRQLLGGLTLGVLAWGAEGIGLYIILEAMGVHVDLWLAVSIYGVAVLAGAISFLPGGLGGTEAVMTLLLIASGVDKSTAFAATLVCRLATLWFAVLVGLIAMTFNTLYPYSADSNKTLVSP